MIGCEGQFFWGILTGVIITLGIIWFVTYILFKKIRERLP